MANSSGINIQDSATPGFGTKIGDQGDADILCQAACAAIRKKKKKGKKAKYQNEMRKILDRKVKRKKRGGGMKNVRGEGGGLSSDMTRGVLTEVGQVVKKGGAGAFVGRWGTRVRQWVNRVAKEPVVKWDIILTKTKPGSSAKPLTWDKVHKAVEVKFPDDDLTKNQKKMAKKSKSRRKNIVMNVEKDCNCN